MLWNLLAGFVSFGFPAPRAVKKALNPKGCRGPGKRGSAILAWIEGFPQLVFLFKETP